MPRKLAKLFWTGSSQAVRLPKEFRLPGKQVSVHRRGAAIVLEPLPESWAWLDALVAPVDADFEKAATERPRGQRRRELDKLWR
ncbi:MAG: AbrB/MazE/SpoVT family DNA-binding domain-containing protein [Acidobacteria bacterium]|nr:MAG: AbrB/MazE/SpoVT family DNA-binding domain-containing protein [Acidobacteriota bacterium]